MNLFLKGLVLITFAVVVAAVMLSFRYQRMVVVNELTLLHQQIDEDRQTIWAKQVNIAEETKPTKLESRLLIADVAVDTRKGIVEEHSSIQPVNIRESNNLSEAN